MAYMRSTIAFGLIWINIIINGLIIFFFTQIKRNNYLEHHSYNLRGTKEKQLKSNYNEQPPKNLRNLKAEGLEQIILYLDSASMLFVILLMISFCITKKECCTNDPEVNRGFAVGSCFGACICCDKCCRLDHCDCSELFKGSGDGDDAIGYLIFLIIIFVFVLLLLALKACGKNILRIISVLFLFFLDLGMVGLAFASSSSDAYLNLIIIFSLIAAICNILGILLPNLSRCKYLSYGFTYQENPVNNSIPIINPETIQQSVSSDFLPQNISSEIPPQSLIEIPPEKPMVPIYNDPNPGYNNSSGNIYDASSVAPPSGNPRPNIYGYIPPPANNYPSQQ
jgi:hypothetical protein